VYGETELKLVHFWPTPRSPKTPVSKGKFTGNIRCVHRPFASCLSQMRVDYTEVGAPHTWLLPGFDRWKQKCYKFSEGGGPDQLSQVTGDSKQASSDSRVRHNSQSITTGSKALALFSPTAASPMYRSASSLGRSVERHPLS